MNVIDVSHLNKKYGNFTAVKDISFHVKEGELFGFLGINGAGKSTTIHMLTTLLRPNEGTALARTIRKYASVLVSCSSRIVWMIS